MHLLRQQLKNAVNPHLERWKHIKVAADLIVLNKTKEELWKVLNTKCQQLLCWCDFFL